jgi:hypothetical protein
MTTRLLPLSCLAISVFVACGNDNLDRAKFDNLVAAGIALEMDLSGSDGAGSIRFPDLLKGFDDEIVALDGQVSGRRETAVLAAFATTREAYRYFRRFRDLDADAVQGMVLLKGANRPLASRYGLPMESRGGGRWVDRRFAMKVFADRAATEFSNARGLLVNK